MFFPGALLAQITTGALEGTLRDGDGRRLGGVPIRIAGAAGFHTVILTDSAGQVFLTLPYGRYRLSAEAEHSDAPPSPEIYVSPLQIARIDLIGNTSGSIRVLRQAMPRLEGAPAPGTWSFGSPGRLYPEPFSLAGILLSREPSSVTEPLDFVGLADNRRAIASQRGFSWTGTQYKLQGMDATDSYQPGRAANLPDVQALDEVAVRSSFAGPASPSEVGVFLSEARASWHGSMAAAGTAAALAATNLPAPPDRGLVQQAARFQWLTRDHAEVGGPFNRWADFYASASGQWSSQTEPLAAPGTDQRGRLLFGAARGRVRAGAANQFDALYSGSRIDLSDGGIPAGLEAWTANRMAPSFVRPGGFPGQSEVDHFDFVQLGWTRIPRPPSRLGVIEVRYGYSTAHLDTGSPRGQSRIELLGSAVSGPPPLANMAVRPRHQIAAAWQPAPLRVRGSRHQVAADGEWKTSAPRNRFTTPSDQDLVTAAGAPAFVMDFNTPLDSRGRIRSFSGYLADRIGVTPKLSISVSALADWSRGSIPAQSSPAGSFTPARAFAPQSDLIQWNQVSPAAGFAWQVPHSHGLVLRAAYLRRYAPLAGRYLDFGNPNSPGGSVYQWTASGPDGPFQPDSQGRLLLRWGGPYSSIDPALGRPYSDEFDVAAELSLPRRSAAGLHLFRRDEKNRIAAIDTGVPAQSFAPVSILDPGPDGIAGTFDDQRLTVYAQNPATLGQDRYLLTNPPGLRMLNTGLLAEVGTAWRGATVHASFVAEKSYGPTNPGDASYENDPGVIGALFLDPNTLIHAAGRTFVDRAFVGKIQARYRLPSFCGGIEVASVVVYTDGLVFARQLLVTGLPQGPLLVASTVRGSPEGGNRTQYAVNWNLRFSREFALSAGRLALTADILNVTNAAQRLQENDLSGASFNLRLPVAIQPPRFVRLGVRYEF
jgi:hypothetical protein